MPNAQDSIDAMTADASRRHPHADPFWLREWQACVFAVAVLTLGFWVASGLRRGLDSERQKTCATNLKQIGQAILLYTNAHRNRFPDSFATLARDSSARGTPVDLAMFACSSDAAGPPKDADDLAAGRCDYVLIVDSMRSQQPSPSGFKLYSSAFAEEAVAIERPGHHGDAGVHVLFADGHVEQRRLDPKLAVTWAEMQDDVMRGRPIRWPASQPVR